MDNLLLLSPIKIALYGVEELKKLNQNSTALPRAFST
jgi:hypothetical protein